jgi:hypothetical protein
MNWLLRIFGEIGICLVVEENLRKEDTSIVL